MDVGHFATPLPVPRYTNLMRLAKERRHRLGETLKLHEVKREVDELHSWISDKARTSWDKTYNITVLQNVPVWWQAMLQDTSL